VGAGSASAAGAVTSALAGGAVAGSHFDWLVGLLDCLVGWIVEVLEPAGVARLYLSALENKREYKTGRRSVVAVPE